MTHVDVMIPDRLLSALKKAPHEVDQQGVLSMERAAETADVSRAEFLEELSRRRVDVFTIDDQDLARELGDA